MTYYKKIKWFDEKIFKKTFQYAEKKHQGQFRPQTNLPFVIHPIKVATFLADEEDTDMHVIVTCLLHDVLEKTETKREEIQKKFRIIVAKFVDAISRDKKEISNQKTRYKQFFSRYCYNFIATIQSR